MGEFEEKLDQILNNPQAMEQIMSIARSLGGSPPNPTDVRPEPNPCSTPIDSPGEGGFDPELLTSIMSLLAQSQHGSNERIALLQALRPFVKEQRYAKLDKAIQIARFSRLIRMALELFHTKEEPYV